MRPAEILASIFLFVSVGCFSQANPWVIKDLVYYDGEEYDDRKHRLNLVLSTTPDSPLLLWVHGGAWSAGDRSDEMPLAKKLAKQGVSVAVMSYRLSPAEFRNPPKIEGVQYPAHINDVARAFRWIHDHASDYDYSQDKLFIGGFSAGAHLSALFAMDPRYIGAIGLRPADIKGCVPISGAYDITKYFEAIDSAYDRSFAIQHVNGVFGPSDNFEEASPVTYINHQIVPMLVQTDGALALYADTFRYALKEKGREDVSISYYWNFNHEGLYRDLLFTDESKARNELISFVKKHSE